MVLALLPMMALGCAAASGFLLSRLLCDMGARAYRHVAAMEASGADVLLLVLKGGFGPALPLCERLVARPRIEAFSHEASAFVRDRFAMVIGEAAVLSWMGFALACVFLVSAVLSASVVCGLACCGCFVAMVVGAVRAAEERRIEAIRSELPSALSSMSVCFRAGYSLQQTLKQVAEETEGSLSEAFVSSACVLETGGTVSEALDVLKRKSQSSELAFVCAALNIQHLAGGSLTPVLEAARESVQGDIELKRSLRVQTSQARLSARIVTVMPFLLIAVFSLVSESFLEPFFASGAGLLLLVTALLMQLAGVTLVRRMLDVKVG